jgi:hypothetical protein
MAGPRSEGRQGPELAATGLTKQPAANAVGRAAAILQHRRAVRRP